MMSVLNSSLWNTLKDFFIEERGIIAVPLFGPLHSVLLIVLILSLILIFIYRNKIRNLSPKVKKIITITSVSILFLNMKVYYFSQMIFGTYDWKLHLPIHMCFIAGYLLMFAVIFKRKKLHQLAYFLSFVGPLPAIIFPEFKGLADTFIFYQFIISHHFLLIVNLFFYFSHNLQISFTNLKKTFLVANLIFISVTIFNYFFGTNYIFSKGIPPHVMDFMPFLYHINYPVLLLEVAGLFALFMAYFPVYLSKKLDKKTE